LPNLDVKRQKSSRKSRNKLKNLVISFYGGKCKICGEKDIRVLSLDHINGGGTKHRRDLGSGGRKIYYALKREGFPTGFQVLCLNHNCSLISKEAL
jgi:hypothetical protein